MHIIYIHQHFKAPSQAGGARPWQFSRRLVRDGHRVTMICGGDHQRSYNIDGIHVRQLAAPYNNGMGFRERVFSFLKFTAKATFAAVTTKGDVIYASSTPLTVAIPARIASALRRTPYVFEVRDVWPKVPIQLGYLRNPLLQRMARALERWAYAGAHEVVALSPGMAHDVRRTSSHSAVTVITNSSDIPSSQTIDHGRHSSQVGPASIHIVYVGSLGRIYDPEWLVHFASELRIHGVTLTIYGEGGPREACLRLANRLGMPPAELLPGPLPKEEVAGVLQRSAACVSCLIDHEALDDSSLNKVFDALAVGVPLIFNHGGWLAGMCVEEGAGIRISRDPTTAAQETHAFLHDLDRQESSQKASRALGKAMFDRDDQYNELLTVLNRAIRTSTAHPGGTIR